MANQQSSSSGLFKSIGLKKHLLFLLGALIVFRIGAHTPVPGVDAVALAKLYESAGSGILGMLNMFSGGSLERFSIFAIGIMSYISASTIVQLASEILPPLKFLKKEEEAGRKVITKYMRYGTVSLAILQSLGVATFVSQQGIVVAASLEFHISTVVCLITGTMFLMWLGEQMTERGIGNGISLIIIAGIVAGIPAAIVQLVTLTNQGSMSIFTAISIIFDALLLIYIVVYFESVQRKIPTHYTKRQFGNDVIQGQNAHMPSKLNMAGIISPIFTPSIILFPSTLLSWFGSNNTDNLLHRIAGLLQHGQPLYICLFAATIIFFCYFYTTLVFSPKEMAEDLKESNAFMPGIHLGGHISRYLEGIVLRLTLFGALYTTVICLVPEFLTTTFNIPFYLGDTPLLILVVVTMDFNTQINSYRMSQQCESLMKRTDMKSLSRK